MNSRARTVGEALRVLRMRARLSRLEVGHRVGGLSENTVRAYEEDREAWTPARLRVLAGIVHVLMEAAGEPFDSAWSEVRALLIEKLDREMAEAAEEVRRG